MTERKNEVDKDINLYTASAWERGTHVLLTISRDFRTVGNITIPPELIEYWMDAIEGINSQLLKQK